MREIKRYYISIESDECLIKRTLDDRHGDEFKRDWETLGRFPRGLRDITLVVEELNALQEVIASYERAIESAVSDLERDVDESNFRFFVGSGRRSR